MVLRSEADREQRPGIFFSGEGCKDCPMDPYYKTKD